MPTRLIDSTPPPIVMSCWPDITCAAAKLTLSRPEAQKRLICTPGTLSPKPAASAPMRAMSPPASPTAIDAAHHDIVDLAGVEVVALADRLQRRRREMQRRGGMQRTVRLAAPARGADVIVNESVGHISLLERVR